MGLKTVGSEFLVNATINSQQLNPDITALAGGGFVVTWDDPSGLGGDLDAGIKAQLYAADGTRLGGEFLVNTVTDSAQVQSQITALSNGGFVVVWQSFSSLVNAYEVKARAYGADGSPAGSEFLIDNTASFDQNSSDITALENGNFVVTWREYNTTFNQDDIKARVYAADGSPAGAEFQVNVGTFAGGDKPSISSLEGGGFVVTWHNDVLIGNDWWGGAQYSGDVSGRVFGADGTAVSGEFTVSTVTGGEQRQVVVQGLADGSFVAVWQDISGVGADYSGSAIKAQLFAADGTKQGDEFVVNTAIQGWQYNPEISRLADGGFVITWEDQSGIGGDSSGNGVKAQMFSADGSKVGDEFLVNTNTLRDQTMPVIAVLANGNFVSVWADSSRIGGDTIDYGIKAQIFGFGSPAAPVIHSDGGGSSAAIAVYEGTTVATIVQADDEDVGNVVTYALGGADASLFTLDANTGVVSFINAPNFASPTDAGGDNVYDVVVTASDGTLSDSQALSITIKDAPDIERIGGEVAVNTITNGGQYTPSITTLSNGNFVVAWIDNSYTEPDTDGQGIRAQLFSADGTKLGDQFVINTVTEGEQYDPQVVGLAGGGYVVAWNSYSAGNGYNLDVKAQTFAADGTKLGDEFFINTTTTDNQYNPGLAALAGGGFVATWDTFNPATSGTDVRVQIFGADGTKVGNEFLANTTTYHEQQYSEVTALADGGFLVTWQAYDSASSVYNINAQRYAADGTQVGGEFLVNSANSRYHEQPAVTGLDNGGFVITWADNRNYNNYNDDAPYEIRAQVYDQAGIKVGGEISVKQSANYSISYHAVTAVNGGNFLVTWSDINQGGGDEVASAVRAQLFSEDGGKIGVEFLVNTTTYGDQSDPAVTRLANGGFAISWTDYNYNTSDQDVRLQVFDIGLTSATPPAISSDGGGASAALSVAENTAAVTTVHATSTKALTYSISGSDAALFDIDSTTGALSFKAAPNFEAPADSGANNVYDVIVTASDGSLSDTQALAITVTNAGEAPVIGTNGGGVTAAISVAENTTAVTTVQAADPDAGTTLTYALSGSDAALFDIDSTTGALSFKAAPNFEAAGDAGTNNVYDVIVTASDGSLSDTQTLAITVTNAGEEPVIGTNGGGAAAAISVAENTTAVTTVQAADPDVGTTLVYSISGSDAALFDIDSTTGALSFKAAPNFEAPADGGPNNVYDVIVTASDGSLSDTQALAITVTDVAEVSVITGNAEKNALTGTSGDDQIFGLAATDRLTGLGGNDLLDGGEGSDLMVGGLGNDTYVVDTSGDQAIEAAGAGTDTVQTGLVRFTLERNVENLTFTSNVAHVGTGNSLDNRLTGGAGNDVLDGLTGADVHEGGLGNDTYYVDAIGDSVIEALGGGTDRVFATASFTLAAGSEVETLTLKSGKAALNLTGSDTANVLNGNSNANVLSGLGGSDTLFGGSGSDTLLGGSGSDVLNGGKGSDRLTGGADADTFVFDARPNAISNLDTITDFTSGSDKLVFSLGVFKAFAAEGGLSAGAFWSGNGVSVAHDADDRFVYNTATGALYYDADGDGRGRAVQVAQLDGHPALAFSDILIAA